MTTGTATSATSSTQESVVSLASRGRGSVQLDRLERRYGNVLAVNDVSLNVAPGEFVTLLGPSGSGKTTTLMMIAGFEIPDAGSIWIDGSDITRLPPHRRNLGVIFQNYALFPHMTVEENVAYPLRMQRRPKAEIRQRVQQSLALVQLDGLGQRLPSQLSGGQQQRVAIARALVFDPPVLLLDEPLGALDKKLRQHLQGELKALHQQSGKTMIYVTHDQEEALSMSNRVAVMKDGVIRQVGTPKEIYQRPADLFVATFVGETNLLPIQPNTGGGRPSALTRSGVLIPLPADSPPALEGDGVVCIRPEKLSVEQTPGHGEAWNARIPGTIQSTTFVGDATYLRFQGDGNEQLIIKQLNQGPESPYSAGARAIATWEPDDAIVFSNGSLEEDLEDGIR